MPDNTPIPAPVPDPSPATKTIKLPNVTIWTMDPAKSVPFKFDALGRVIQGHNEVVQITPGQPVTLPAAEAIHLLRRHGGSEIDPNTGAVIRTFLSFHERQALTAAQRSILDSQELGE